MKKDKHTQSISETPKHRSTKNRRKWCKGKVGIEHDCVWRDVYLKLSSSGEKKLSHKEFVCVNCGKKTDIWADFLDSGTGQLAWLRLKKYEEPVTGSRVPKKEIHS